MSQSTNRSAVLSTERFFSASPEQVFAAFADPVRLASWWGPDGFTNTFEQFEFKPGGRWVFIMHGPNGADYPNESVFKVIEPDRMIVIEHVAKPWFTLTVSLSPRENGTQLRWDQEFENADMADSMRPLCKTANEQNLDRLGRVLGSHNSD